MKKRVGYFIGFIIVLGIEILIALFVHDKFIRPYIGDVLVMICLYFLVKCFVLEKIKNVEIYLLIFAIIIELLQYFEIARILAGNSRFLKILFGSTFDIKDIICYVVGSLIIYIVKTLIKLK